MIDSVCDIIRFNPHLFKDVKSRPLGPEYLRSFNILRRYDSEDAFVGIVVIRVDFTASVDTREQKKSIIRCLRDI
jgi:hypothetical protein